MPGLFNQAPAPVMAAVAQPPPISPPPPMPIPDPKDQQRAGERVAAATAADKTTRRNTIIGNDDTLG